jgi:hypothetical protein
MRLELPIYRILDTNTLKQGIIESNPLALMKLCKHRRKIKANSRSKLGNIPQGVFMELVRYSLFTFCPQDYWAEEVKESEYQIPEPVVIREVDDRHQKRQKKQKFNNYSYHYRSSFHTTNYNETYERNYSPDQTEKSDSKLAVITEKP